MWLLTFIFMFYLGYRAIDIFRKISKATTEASKPRRKVWRIHTSLESKNSDQKTDRNTNQRTDHNAEIKRLLDDGYVSRAVKLYGEAHGVGMMEAMKAIDKLQNSPASSTVEKTPVLTAQDLNSTAEQAIQEMDLLLAKAGQGVETIKQFDEVAVTGLEAVRNSPDQVGEETSSSSDTYHSATFSVSTNEIERTFAIDDPQVLELIRAGRKIDAIKKIRQNANLSLREAKELVETIQATLK